MKRRIKRDKENVDLSLNQELHSDSQRFKGIAKETRKGEKQETNKRDRKKDRKKVLGENRDLPQTLTPEMNKTIKSIRPLPETRNKLAFKPNDPDMTSPFVLLDNPVSNVTCGQPISEREERICKRRKVGLRVCRSLFK